MSELVEGEKEGEGIMVKEEPKKSGDIPMEAEERRWDGRQEK